MEYQVPQFIDIKDKVFGPLTLKQFIYIAGGVGLSVGLILYLPLLVGIVVAIPVAVFSAALAFYKINNKSFEDIMEAAFKYYISDRLYLWKKDAPVASATPALEGPAAASRAPERAKLGLSRSRLQELAWSLDIKDQPLPPTP